jgi:hypothetical protein
LEAVDFFLSQQETEAALKTWARLVELGQPLRLESSFRLMEELIRQYRAEDARRVWEQALALARIESPPSPPGSVIWDGGFERNFTDGGLGWRGHRLPAAPFDFDTAARSGARCLRVIFAGRENLAFGHITQYVAVEPDTRYRFQAYLRLDGITTDSGVRFRIYDRSPDAAFHLMTPGLTGTLPWTLQEAEFTTGPRTRLLGVTLTRQPSRKLDNKITGTVWVDDVSLVSVASTAQAKR